MDPLTIGSAVVGGLWVWDKLTGGKTPLRPPRQVDLNACEPDPTGKHRVVRHQLRAHVQNACRSLTLRPIIQDTLPLPGWYSIGPLQVQGETDAYSMIGEAVKRGYWVAIRLDSIHDPNGGILSMGTREETLRLCAGPDPFAILARPKERQQPPAEKKDIQQTAQQTTFDERVQVIQAIMRAMTPEEREKFLAETQRKAQANGDYVKHSPPVEVVAEVVERPAAE